MKFVPSIGADYSGSLGGITASRNRYGSYFRRKSSPVNPNSTRQQAVRAYFATAVVGWTSLTAAQRSAWNTYAANTPFVDGLGNQRFVTGQNMYIRSAVLRAQIGEALIATAPTEFNFGNPVTSYYPTNAGTAGFDQIGEDSGVSTTVAVMGNTSDDGDVIAYVGAPINVSRGFYKGPYQLMGSASTTAADPTVALGTGQAQAEALVAGQYRSLRLVIAYDDGRVSPSYETLAPVVDDSV